MRNLIAHQQNRRILFTDILRQTPPILLAILVDDIRTNRAQVQNVLQGGRAGFHAVATPTMVDDPRTAPFEIDALVLVIAYRELASG